MLAGKALGQGQPGASLLEGQEDVLLAAEVHEIALPMSESDAPVSFGGSLINGNPVGD